MFSFLRRKDPLGEAATELYGSVVAQTRRPEFYTLGQIPDTLEGRFELLMLHLWLVIDRVRETEGHQQGLGRALTSRFVTDIDDTYREFGIGDQSVPAKVKKAAAALYDRTLEYRALSEGEDWDGLAQALATHVHRSEDAAVARYLVDYTRIALRHLSDVPTEALHAGQVSFPEPLAQFDV